MQKKNVDDYLSEGIYGTRRPLEAERRKYLGTLRERIVIALTIGQVMTDSALEQLDEAIKNNQDNTQLLINGKISYRFTTGEKALANKHDIPYTIITQDGLDTDIGAVLTYDYAINKESIFIEDIEAEKAAKEKMKENKVESKSLFSRFRNWFK